MLKAISIPIDLRSLLLLDTSFHLITKLERIGKNKEEEWITLLSWAICGPFFCFPYTSRKQCYEVSWHMITSFPCFCLSISPVGPHSNPLWGHWVLWKVCSHISGLTYFFIFFFCVGHKWDQLYWVSGLKSHRLNQRLGVKSTEGLTSGFQDGSLTRLLAGSLNLSLASGRSSQFLTVNLTHIAVWGSWQLTSHQANDLKQKEKAVAAVYLTT